MDLLTLAMIKNKQGGGSSSGGSVNNNAYIIETSISTDVNTGDSVITLDKTFLEIKNQYMLGRQILLKVDPNGDGNHVAYFSCTGINSDSQFYEVIFTEYVQARSFLCNNVNDYPQFSNQK